MPRSILASGILTLAAIVIGISSLVVTLVLPSPVPPGSLSLLVLLSLGWALLHFVGFVLALVGIVSGHRTRHSVGIPIAALVVNVVGAVPAGSMAFLWVMTAMLVASADNAGFVH